VIERVSERAERVTRAIEHERDGLDERTEADRAEIKRAFLDILRAERRQTDVALEQERVESDFRTQGRDELLAIVSHDLRQLITAIGLKTQSLERKLPDDASEVRKLAHEILLSCRLMERWTGDLLDIAAVDTGQTLPMHFADHAATRFVEDALALFRSKAAAKGVTLSDESTDEHPDLHCMHCDRDRIVQVLANLIGNAIKFSPRGGKVSIRVEPAGEMLRFSVRDEGEGIAAEWQERIFDRSWHTSQHEGGGAGLGLYISKMLVEAHGGRIGVESAPGAGSTFFFTIPAR